MKRSRTPSESPTPFTTRGAKQARAWLNNRGLACTQPWHVELALDLADREVSLTYSHDTDTRFHLNVYPVEWGVFFCHGSRASWVRVTDEPFVHGRDDYRLLRDVGDLDRVGELLRLLETRHDLRFSRQHALIRTNVSGGKSAVRAWLATL